MQTMSQLKTLREQMIEELTRIPQYRALKAMERFIDEMGGIYDASSFSANEQQQYQEKITQAVESRIRRDPAPAQTLKVTPYIPAHRVA